MTDSVTCPQCQGECRPSQIEISYTEPERHQMGRGMWAIDPARAKEMILPCQHVLDANEWMLRVWPEGAKIAQRETQ